MKALVVAPQPFFSPRGTPFSVYYRTLVTAELGVEVDLLTYGEGQDVDIPGVRIIRIPQFRFLGPVKTGPSLLKLFLDSFLVLWTIALLLRRRYDFVHAHEEAVFFCRFLKPIFRFRMVYDMHSSLPQQLSNFGFTRSRMLIGLFDRLEKTCLRAADAVITICPELAEYALTRVRDPRRHFLIENSIFEDVRFKDADPAADAESSAVALPDGRQLVVYAGTFERYQGLDRLIRAFAEVHLAKPEALLLLVGGSSEQVRQMRRLAADVGLNGHCIFTGRVPPSLAKHYLKQAAVVVSPRTEGNNTPLKVYEQLASGIPLVATRIRSHTQVLNDQVCFLVAPEPSAMAHGILEAMENVAGREEIVRQARDLYRRNYSRAMYTQKLRQLLETLKPCAE